MQALKTAATGMQAQQMRAARLANVAVVVGTAAEGHVPAVLPAGRKLQ